jgi:hypothetical protein
VELIEVPVTVEDVIRILQMYKPSAQKIFRNKVNLAFSREKKEILFEIPAPGNFYSKKVVYYQLGYRVLGLEELIRPVALLRLVDEWIELLDVDEAEAVFWRYVNHDFERDLDDNIRRYATLSYEEIAKKMNTDPKCVWRYCRRALAKILSYVNQEVSDLEG